MQIFIGYFVITGLITFAWFWFSVNRDVESEDAIADLTWNTGIRREHIKTLLYTLALLLGWIILPYEIADRIFKLEKE